MPRRIFDFDPPDRFVPGTIGEPGHRTFYLQARRGDEVVTVVIEKAQVAALAERLALLLAELRRGGASIPTAAPSGTDDTAPLEEPLREAFRTGTLSIGWDSRVEELILEARALSEDEETPEEGEDDDPSGPDLLRVRLTPTAALGFVARAARIVAAGRPPCPWCGQPLDPQGHFCPRRNGGRAN